MRPVDRPAKGRLQDRTADQQLLTKISTGAALTLRKQVRKDNESAKKQMERKGVKITEPAADLVAGVDKAALDVRKELTGRTFSKAELDMVLKYRAEYRAKNPAKFQ